MKVVCDNCRAVYKVPDDKLTKAVNKATCRNCGHRMLIPRPKPNADPEERTLVTAVPPTPVGAPPRTTEPAGGRSAGPDDLRVPTPMMSVRTEGPRMDAGRAEPSWNEPAPARAIDQTRPGPEEDFDGPDTKLAISPGEQDTAREAAREARGRGGPSMPPGSLPPGRSPPIKRSPTPTPAPPPGAMSHVAAAISPSASREMPLPSSGGLPPGRKLPQSPSLSQSTPQPIPREMSRDSGTPRPAPPARSAPPPRSGAYPAMALHDPAGDLNWALLGTGTALIGGFLLAFLSIWNHPLVMWFGLAMTFGGGLLTFMVLLTGARGRRPAKTFLSVLFGGIFAVVTSTMMVATKWGAERVIDAYDISFSDVGLRSGISVPSGPSLAAANTAVPVAPLPAPATPEPPEPAPPPVEPAPSKAPAPAPPPRPVPQPPPQPSGRTTAPPPTPQPVVQPVVPAPPPEPVPVPTPPPAPVPTPKPTVGMETVPMEVIFVMLSNNLEVKKCFVPLMKAGSLPPRVDLKFNIMPDGRATSAMVLQNDYRGSTLEACLVRAVTGITFPPTTGSGTAITFPFVLQ